MIPDFKLPFSMQIEPVSPFCSQTKQVSIYLTKHLSNLFGSQKYGTTFCLIFGNERLVLNTSIESFFHSMKLYSSDQGPKTKIYSCRTHGSLTMYVELPHYDSFCSFFHLWSAFRLLDHRNEH